MIGNKTAGAVAKSYNSNIMQVLKNSQQNNSETVTNENDKETSKERFISPEKRQEIIDNLRLKWYNNGVSKIYKSLKHFTTK